VRDRSTQTESSLTGNGISGDALWRGYHAMSGMQSREVGTDSHLREHSKRGHLFGKCSDTPQQRFTHKNPPCSIMKTLQQLWNENYLRKNDIFWVRETVCCSVIYVQFWERSSPKAP